MAPRPPLQIIRKPGFAFTNLEVNVGVMHDTPKIDSAPRDTSKLRTLRHNLSVPKLEVNVGLAHDTLKMDMHRETHPRYVCLGKISWSPSLSFTRLCLRSINSDHQERYKMKAERRVFGNRDPRVTICTYKQYHIGEAFLVKHRTGGAITRARWARWAPWAAP